MSGTAPISSASASALPLAAPVNDRAKLHEAAQKFEAIMVRQMLASARAGGAGDQLTSSQAAETFASMRDERFADIASKSGGLGFGKMIEAQLAKQAGLGSPTESVIPAKAGTQNLNKQTPLRDFNSQGLGSGLRRNDENGVLPHIPAGGR